MDSRLLLLGYWLLGHRQIWVGVGSSGMGAFVPHRLIGVGRHFFGSSGGVGVVDVTFAVLIVGWLVYLLSSLRCCTWDLVAHLASLHCIRGRRWSRLGS